MFHLAARRKSSLLPNLSHMPTPSSAHHKTVCYTVRVPSRSERCQPGAGPWERGHPWPPPARAKHGLQGGDGRDRLPPHLIRASGRPGAGWKPALLANQPPANPSTDRITLGATLRPVSSSTARCPATDNRPVL